MSSKQPATVQQVQKTELPAWVEGASLENYNLAKSLAERPYQPYTGKTVADTSPFTQQAYDYLNKVIGSTDPLFQKATASLDDATGYQKQAVPLYDKVGSLYDKSTGVLDAATQYRDRATGAFDAATADVGKAGDYFTRAGDIFEGTMPLYTQAGEWADRAGSIQGEAADIYRKTAGPLDINQFLNPYTNEVEKNAINNAERSLAAGQLGITDAARKARAFGGSRDSIQHAVLGAEGARGIGDLSAQLRKAGIDFATNTAIADRSGKQAAAGGLLNTGTGYLNTGRGILDVASGMRDTGANVAGVGRNFLDSAGVNRGIGSDFLNTFTGELNRAGGYRDAASGTLGQARGLLDASTAAGSTAAGYNNTAAGVRAAQLQDLTSMFGAGDMQRTQAQTELDDLARRFYEQRDYPTEALNMRLAALGMSPYGKTETTNKTSTSENKGTDWATLGLGLAKIAMLSDRTTKTDIEKLGTDPETGLPMYAFRYKGDPKEYPKIVGPMAQDVEKKYPSAVHKIGGKRVIHLGNLMEALA